MADCERPGRVVLLEGAWMASHPRPPERSSKPSGLEHGETGTGQGQTQKGPCQRQPKVEQHHLVRFQPKGSVPGDRAHRCLGGSTGCHQLSFMGVRSSPPRPSKPVPAEAGAAGGAAAPAGGQIPDTDVALRSRTERAVAPRVSVWDLPNRARPRRSPKRDPLSGRPPSGLLGGARLGSAWPERAGTPELPGPEAAPAQLGPSRPFPRSSPGPPQPGATVCLLQPPHPRPRSDRGSASPARPPSGPECPRTASRGPGRARSAPADRLPGPQYRPGARGARLSRCARRCEAAAQAERSRAVRGSLLLSPCRRHKPAAAAMGVPGRPLCAAASPLPPAAPGRRC
ncbi:uncharacterized protein LOC115599178 [Calypte anna]|uniref:uncharacterized protein LOC115599178 n=1 Tax=Calypte anna TaxID=9244 RepID=UPI0011C48762|nr:uncharacterized protein LOC115599178 [Calypte anna]